MRTCVVTLFGIVMDGVVSMDSRSPQRSLTSSHARLGIALTVAILVLSMLTCGWPPKAPSRLKPTISSIVAIEIVEVPNVVCVGDTVTFTIRTTPGNGCEASVGYYDAGKSWISQRLERTFAADNEGLCTWSWLVPTEVASGEAEVRMEVEDERNFNSTGPIPFEIRGCGK